MQEFKTYNDLNIQFKSVSDIYFSITLVKRYQIQSDHIYHEQHQVLNHLN